MRTRSGAVLNIKFRITTAVSALTHAADAETAAPVQSQSVNSVDEPAQISYFALVGRCLMSALIVLVLCAGRSAFAADDPTKHFEIKAKPLADALLDFGVQSGLNVSAPAPLTAGKKSAPVHGDMPTSDALRRLLKGSGLSFTRRDDGTIAIQAPAVGGPVAARAGEAALDKESIQNGSVAEVVVTGTRIVREGFVAPTPVTTMTNQDMQIAGYSNIGQALQDLPIEKGTFTPATQSRNTSVEGMNLADLRGLGYQRTLVLVDGQRPVFQSPMGFDMNSIPIALVQRVDIVTGGASAAWGSDAVSGVINIVLNNNFVGEKVDLQYGDDWQRYGQNYRASVAFGKNFGPDDRGHFMVGGQWTDSAMIPSSAVPQLGNYFIKNPAYTATNQLPQYLMVSNYNFSGESQGGLIVAGPLKGTAFGPGGTPYPFQYGTYANGTYMSGGDPEAVSGRFYPTSSAEDKDVNKNLYGRLSYDVSSALTLKMDLLYSNFYNIGAQVPPGTNYIGGPFTIQNTNAFLPPSIAAQMASDQLTSFAMGRANTDFGGVGGNITGTIHTQTYWGTVGADGKFGDNWSYSLFYNHGVTNYQLLWGPQVIPDLLAESVNSIISPTTHQPICASTALKNPITGASCVPVNLFGYGSPSAASLAFFEGNADSYYSLTQNEAGAEVQGEPFSTWAGPVSVVGGLEWRTESINQTADPYSLAGDFLPVNYTDESGRYSVTEGFAEIVAPLLKGLPAAQEFDFNGAVRESRYSTSGDITSWKLGVTDKATGELLLRATVSQDIRAPNLNELYTQRSVGAGPIIDPQNGNSQYSVTNYSGGNPNLLPEIAHTTTYGGVYSPRWLPGFNLSVDWWAINIHDAITTESAQTIVNYCFEGDTVVCPNIVRNSAGIIQYVNTNSINLAQLASSGLDLEASDHLMLGDVWNALPGSLDSHLLTTYVDKMEGSDGVQRSSAVGSLLNLSTAPAQVRWRTTLTETYNWGQFQSYVRYRFLSGGYYEPPPITINDNRVAAQSYVDLGASYFLTSDKKYQIYGNIVNVADRQSPIIPAPIFYDEFGRTFNVGARFSF